MSSSTPALVMTPPVGAGPGPYAGFMSARPDQAHGLIEFLNASPSPFHAAARAAAMLEQAGYCAIEQSAPWSGPDALLPGRGYLVREGALVAWDLGAGSAAEAGACAAPFRIVGAHTDSPNLRVKPQPDLSRFGWDQLGVEVYGGPLLNSWLDRDLGLAGRVLVRADGSPGTAGLVTRLFRVDEPVLRIPQLAIHLDRAVSEEGLRLNPQTHMVPVWGATAAAPAFAAYLADLVGCAVGDLLGSDVMTYDLTPARRVGLTGDLIAGARLDNLASCYAAVCALIDAGARGPSSSAEPVRVVVLFDHEEIGSTTDRGAVSPLLFSVLERLVTARGGTREDVWRALADTVIASADMSHAVHPNYPERHEPQHAPMVNAGPVIKINNRGRYATEALGTAVIRLAAQQADVPLQMFLSRADMPCGSTIGPFAAAGTGATTVDLGCAMLAMHSARELAGAADPGWYSALLAAFLRPA